MNLVEKAKEFATVAHQGQLYGNKPYTVHLEDVVTRLGTITDDQELLAAAWLHDTIEDCEVSVDTVAREFGQRVSNLVWALTGTGSSRALRINDAIKKILETPGAELVKSADRLSNASACIRDGRTDLFELYRKEHKILSPVLGDNELARELNKLFE
jgi:(p)ppGpp synthase/HD superfamily hydrolase